MRGLAVDGWHPGAVDLTRASEAAQFDSKMSAVFKDGRWLLYGRANLVNRGGRYVMVARSTTEQPFGGLDAYEPFQMLEIDGYDRDGPGNIYMMVVNHHPLISNMLLGLMPINHGQEGIRTGDGFSYIALSFSCNGVHWSRPIQLMESQPLDARTYDQPVDGLLLENGEVHFLIHHDVPLISPNAPTSSRIVKYQFNREQLESLSEAASSTLRGCSSNH